MYIIDENIPYNKMVSVGLDGTHLQSDEIYCIYVLHRCAKEAILVEQLVPVGSWYIAYLYFMRKVQLRINKDCHEHQLFEQPNQSSTSIQTFVKVQITALTHTTCMAQ